MIAQRRFCIAQFRARSPGVSAHHAIADAEIQKEYEKAKAATGDKEYRASHILVASEDDAKSVLADLKIEVQEQVVDGDRVTSRFVVSGTSHGRHVRFGGITISRFEGDLIVEDWSVTDTLALVRQLGAWRAVLVGAKQWRARARLR